MTIGECTSCQIFFLMSERSGWAKFQYYSTVYTLMTSLISKGLMENCRGITFPMIREYFSLTYDYYDLFNSCLSICYVCALLVCTLLSGYMDYKVILLIGYVCNWASAFALLLCHSFFSTACCIAVMWFGQGFLDLGANAASTCVFTKNPGLMMSIMHFFYGIGALVGPIIASKSAVSLGNSFYSAYIVLGSIVTGFFCITLFLPFSVQGAPASKKTDAAKSMTLCSSLKNPLIWYCSLAIGPMLITEQSGSGWAPLYLVDVLGYDLNTDVAMFTSSMYVIFTVSRLISGPAIDRLGYYLSESICLIGCFTLLLIGFCIGRAGIWLFAATGFFYSAFWPIFVCIVMQLFKKDSAVVTSICLTFQGILMIPMNYILGVINEHIGNQWAYRCSLFFCLFSLVMVCILYRFQKKIDTEEKNAGEIEMTNPTVEVKVGEEKDASLSNNTAIPTVIPIKSDKSD